MPDDELPYFSPRHPGRPRRSGNGWIIGMAATAIAITLVLVIGVRAVLVRALCEQGPVRLHVAASLDIAPAVQQIGKYFNDLNRDVGGHCAQVEVTEDAPGRVAAELSGMGTITGESPIDAWVPDSSLWLNVVRNSARGAAAARPTGVSVARSPLVITAPRSIAGVVGRSSTHIGWRTLFPQSLGGPSASLHLQVQLPDPAHNAAGLASLVEVRRLLGGQPAARDEFTNFVHNVRPSASFDDPQALSVLSTLAEPPWLARPVTVTSEQAVEAYNKSTPGRPLIAYYPAQEYDLDFPFALATSSSLKIQAAQLFEQVLRSSFASGAVRGDGFRSANGQTDTAGSQFGIVGDPQPAVALAAPGEASTALQAWNRLSLGSRDLVLDDISGAMTQPLGLSGQTRFEVLQAAAIVGLSLFPDSTQMGVWEYSYQMNGSLPYRMLVPVGPLPAQLGLITRRQQLLEVSNVLAAQPGAPAAMYESVLAAFRWMTANYQPGHVNAVIVLGSGTNTARGGMSLSQLLARLRADYDPRRPVEIIMVTAGTDADQAALREITAISHGASYTVEQPSDIANVFFDALARRICEPNCGR
ncbi:MAG TPA: substrate-binding domain-containing protein [Streptosporangiaceae bacterium]|nr:substrate-binding domain-containing protein [Streptosporangiaceae bacterium]